MGILKFKDFHNIEIDELSSIIMDSLKAFEIYSFTEVQNMIDVSFDQIEEIWKETRDEINDLSIKIKKTNNAEIKQNIVPNNLLIIEISSYRDLTEKEISLILDTQKRCNHIIINNDDETKNLSKFMKGYDYSFKYLYDMPLKFWTKGYDDTINISLYERNWKQTCQIKDSLNDIIKPKLKVLGYYPLFSYGGSAGHSGVHDFISISINKLTKRIEEE